MRKKRLFSFAYKFTLLICLFLAAAACETVKKTETKSYPLIHNSDVKNIIFLIGDGMGISQIASARVKAFGADKRLNMEKMPITGLVETHSYNNLVTDSAAAATAMATGYKTNNGMVSVNPNGENLLTIFEAVKKVGYSTGLAVTSTVTHATPACFAAHVLSRNREGEIAPQLIENKVNVILGGGRKFFIPRSVTKSARKDSRDLIAEAKNNGYLFVKNKYELKLANKNYIIGLFELGPLTTKPPEPTLAEMTSKAIDILKKNDKGFFLIVEGSQIDWACHANNASDSIKQTLLFDEAVKVSLDFAAKERHTLVVVTADHETGGMAISGGTTDGKKIKIKWISKNHTAAPVPLYAFGPGAENFTGLHDNTEIPRIFAFLLNIEGFPKITFTNASIFQRIYSQIYARYLGYLGKG